MLRIRDYSPRQGISGSLSQDAPPARSAKPACGLHFWWLSCQKCFCVTFDKQCQLVKNSENRINGLNIGIKLHLGVNLDINGVNNAICRAVFLFYCMANKQVWKISAMWYNDSVSQNRYVKLTGTWNLCWRAKFLSGLIGSVCFLIRPYTSGGSSPECSRRKWRQVLKAIVKSTWWICFRFCFSNVTCPVM